MLSQTRFREPKCVWQPGSVRTRWGGGSLSAPLDPSAAIGEGPTSKGNGGKWRGMGRKGE